MNRSQTPLRSRSALALLVAIACFAALAGAALLTGGGGAAGASLKEPADAPQGAQRATPAHSHSSDRGARGLNERERLAVETATLGPEHAAEHAATRRAQRRPEPTAVATPDATPDDATTESRPLVRAAAVNDALDPAEFGRWNPAASVTFPIVAIHAALLPTGKVMIFAFPQSPRENSAQAWVWDPATGQKVRKDPPDWLDPGDGKTKPANIWCSGHTFTADGELLVFGGNLAFDTATAAWKGLNKVYTFNPFAPNGGSWQEQPDMRHGRWYPSGVRLADGRIPIVSGLDETGDPSTNNMNEEVELFTPPAARGGQGSLSLLGSTDYTPSKGLPPTGETYPHMFAMPSGRALVAGPDKTQTWFLNTPGTNPWWTPAPAMSQRRNWGTAVPMPAGSGGSSKVMALGGTSLSRDPSTNSTEVFDEANPGQGWLAKPSLNIGRGHANTVLLPDGSMVEVGGGLGRDDSFTQSPQHAATPEQRQIELWDRETGKWKLGPAQAENRAYHSTALLLADGRVLSAGDEVHGGGASDLGEIYEPPYLHTGVPRPTITSAPATIKVGARFGVGTADEDVTRATLVAPGSVTHAVDMNQRVIELDLTRRKGCVDLAAPPNGKVAPPGWYMLFLLNGSGAPSVAKFVRLTEGGATPAQCTEPEVPADTEPPSVKLVAPASPVAGEVRLEADASDNVGVASVRFKAGDQLIADEDPSDNRVDWDTTKIANGPHVLTAVASDAAGNSTTSSPVTVTVKNADKTPPTVTFVRPANGSTVSETIDVVASAADDQAMAQVQFKLDGENLGQPQTSAPYTVRWATRNGAQGTHELTAVARDVADNSSQPAKVTVTVNNPPPPKEPPPVEVPKATQPPPRLAPPVAPPAAPVTPPRVQVPPNAAPRIARLKLAGTRLSFRLSEAARVRVTFERRRPSRRGRATRYSRLRTSLTLRGRAGANSVRFDARRRGFRVGSYRLTALARDARGKRGPAARAGFRVVAVKSSRRARRAALIDGAFGRLAPFAALRP